MRWDPLRELIAHQDAIDRTIKGGASGWLPPIDLYETADRYVVVAELAGLSRDDFELRVERDTLVLRGRRPGRSEAAEQYHRVERGHGAFSRSFEFPQPIDAARVTAEFHDGLLTIALPKVPAPEPRRIPVT